MNDEITTKSLNEYGFTTYDFPTEVTEKTELQQLDLDFCKYAQATGANYIEMCKRVAMIHAKLARAGRYGGGQWLAWIEARGLSKDTARRMVTIGENFNMRNLSTLKNLEDMPRGLLYAASKQDASPQAWELLSSSDPTEVEKGKLLLNAEKQIAAARKEFAEGTQRAYNAALEWKSIAKKLPGVYNAPQFCDIREVAECVSVEEANKVMAEQMERHLKNDTIEELVRWMNRA